MISITKRIPTVIYLWRNANLSSFIYLSCIFPKRPLSRCSPSLRTIPLLLFSLWLSLLNIFRNVGMINIAITHEAVREIITTMGIYFMNFPMSPVSSMRGMNAAEMQRKVTVTGHTSSDDPLSMASDFLSPIFM